MDPQANLDEQKRIRARQFSEPGDHGRMKELRAALRAWIANGGFDPRKRVP